MKTILGFLGRRKKQAVWLAVFALLPLLAGSGLVILVSRYREFLGGLGSLDWLLVFLFLSLPIALSLVPNTLAGLLAGYFLGWAGLPAMVISFSLACLIGYRLGKITGEGFLEDASALWPALSDLHRRFSRRPLSLVFALRLMPAPPFAIGSLVLAWLKIPFSSYFAGSLAGMMPRMALVVWLGKFAGDLQQISAGADVRQVLPVSLLAGLGLLILYLRFFRGEN